MPERDPPHVVEGARRRLPVVLPIDVALAHDLVGDDLDRRAGERIGNLLDDGLVFDAHHAAAGQQVVVQRRLDAAVDVVGLGAIDQRALENRGGLAGRRVPIGEPPAYIRLGGPPIQRGLQGLGVGIKDVEGARVAPRGALALGAVALDHEAAVLLPILLVAIGEPELHLPEVGGVLGIGVGPLGLRLCSVSHRLAYPVPPSGR